MADNHPQHILLVCQAGQHIGLGHLSRTLVAAEALHLSGYSLTLLLQCDEGLVQTFENYLTVCKITLTQPLSTHIRKLVVSHCDLVIFDLQPHHVPVDLPELLIQLKAQKIATIAIDALAEFHELLDMIYTPSFRPNAKLSSAQQKTSIFGWDSFLLKVSKDVVTDKNNAVLLLTGGADTTKLGDHWLQELDKKLPQHLTLHWVRGPFASAPALPEMTQREIIIHHAPSSLTNLMNKASFAITLYGVSFFELLYYGVPTVVFSPYNHKDDAELMEVRRQQVALVAADEHDAIIQLQQLLESDELANNIAKAARAKLANANGSRLQQCVASLLRK
ncbi:hypothetical protein [Rheinheimera gaetbuli]